MESESRKVVVLGAGGFIGNAVAAHLAKSGHQVLACSRKPLPSLPQLQNISTANGDIRNKEFLCSVLQGVEVLYHFASSTHPSLNYANPKAEFEDSLLPLIEIIEVAASMHVRKVVFPSSGGTIYAEQFVPCTEATPLSPRTPYAIFKLAAESLLLCASEQGRFSLDIFRIANPYGPGQIARPGQGVIPHWLEATRRSHPLTIYGDGTAARDYVYIDDVCELVSLSVNRLDQTGVFNLGTGIATSLNELVELLHRISRKPIVASYDALRAFDRSRVSLSSSKLLTLAPEFRFTSLSDGLVKTLNSLEFDFIHQDR